MSLESLPDEVQFRVRFFDEQADGWDEVRSTMSTTHHGLKYGDKIPPFSERIPQNLRSFGVAANDAFDAYVEVLGEGAACAASVASTLRASGGEYLRREQYSEELIQEIEKELDE